MVAKSAQKPAYLGGKGDDITLDLLLHADSTQSGSPVQSAANRTGATCRRTSTRCSPCSMHRSPARSSARRGPRP